MGLREELGGTRTGMEACGRRGRGREVCEPEGSKKKEMDEVVRWWWRRGVRSEVKVGKVPMEWRMAEMGFGPSRYSTYPRYT